jgi:hypothetical protein
VSDPLGQIQVIQAIIDHLSHCNGSEAWVSEEYSYSALSTTVRRSIVWIDGHDKSPLMSTSKRRLFLFPPSRTGVDDLLHLELL